MAERKIPLIGSKLEDVSESVNKLANQVAKKQQIYEYNAVIGDNTVSHYQKGVPAGRFIVWSECGNLLDMSLTATKWTFAASIAGKVKVIWL